MKKPTNKVTELPKFPTGAEAETVFDIFKFKKEDRFRKQLEYTLLKWRLRTDENAETLVDFCDEYNIDRDMLYDYANKFPDFKRSFDIVRRSLANKHFKGAAHKRLDREVVMKYIHTLDSEFDEINKYHAKLKSEEPANSGTIFVEIPKSGQCTCGAKHEKDPIE